MALTLVVIGIAAACAAAAVWVTRRRNEAELQRHSISVEQLHSLLASDQTISIFDVRQPLDLLAYPELISGAQRVPPQEVLAKPSLIPGDKDVVVYCTCPSDKTSRLVLRRALALGFSRVRFLRGGLAAWKANGYSVEPYLESFRLDSPAVSPPAAR